MLLTTPRPSPFTRSLRP